MIIFQHIYLKTCMRLLMIFQNTQMASNVLGTWYSQISVKDTCDLRYFLMSTSSKTAYKGIRKVGTCNGSWECQNPYCGFIDMSVDNQPNRVDWLTVKGKKDMKIYSVSKHIAKRQGYGVNKLINYNPKTKIAIVFQIGTHK